MEKFNEKNNNRFSGNPHSVLDKYTEDLYGAT